MFLDRMVSVVKSLDFGKDEWSPFRPTQLGCLYRETGWVLSELSLGAVGWKSSWVLSGLSWVSMDEGVCASSSQGVWVCWAWSCMNRAGGALCFCGDRGIPAQLERLLHPR